MAERLRARKLRVSQIRRRVAAIAATTFLATSGGIFVQLASGNDPALGSVAAKTTATSTAAKTPAVTTSVKTAAVTTAAKTPAATTSVNTAAVTTAAKTTAAGTSSSSGKATAVTTSQS